MRAESNNLNALRALAVLSVFVCHVLHYVSIRQDIAFALGRIGVLLFFVHTSLVLMYSMERIEGKSLWSRFMIRRAFRIFPLSMLAVLFYAAFAIPSRIDFHNITSPALSLKLFLANLTLTQGIAGIAALPNVLWSLPLELQMYAFLPALFLLVRKREASDLVVIWFLCVVGSLCVILMLVLVTGPNYVFSDALVVQYVPCFVVGVIAYRFPTWYRIPGWMFPGFVSAGVISYALIRQHAFFPWFLCGLVGLAIPQFRELPDSPFTRAAGAVAKYSYGIYLFHTFCLWLFLPSMGIWGAVPALVLVVLLSATLYRAIEHPMIEIGKRLASASFETENRPAPLRGVSAS